MKDFCEKFQFPRENEPETREAAPKTQGGRHEFHELPRIFFFAIVGSYNLKCILNADAVEARSGVGGIGVIIGGGASLSDNVGGLECKW